MDVFCNPLVTRYVQRTDKFVKIFDNMFVSQRNTLKSPKLGDKLGFVCDAVTKELHPLLSSYRIFFTSSSPIYLPYTAVVIFLPSNYTFSQRPAQRNTFYVKMLTLFKVQMKCLFYCGIWKSSKIRKIAVYRCLISLLVPELKGLKMSSFRWKSARKSCWNQSKSIKICDVMCWTCWWDEKINR